MSFSKHSLDSTVNCINIFPLWLCLTGAQSTPGLFQSCLTVLTGVFLPPHHCSLSSSVLMPPLVLVVRGGEEPHTVQCRYRQKPRGVVSHEWRWECVLGNGKKSRKHQRLFKDQLWLCVLLVASNLRQPEKIQRSRKSSSVAHPHFFSATI